MAQVKRIGKRIKKATRKDKGKLGELVAEIDKSEPTREKYIVVTVEFYDAPLRHFIVTPFNKEKITDTLRYLTKTKEVGQEFIGSGEVASLKPGMRIKNFLLSTKESFRQKVATKSLFKKKREGAFFPYQHLIKTNTLKSFLPNYRSTRLGLCQRVLTPASCTPCGGKFLKACYRKLKEMSVCPFF